jgi:hypothetical protein
LNRRRFLKYAGAVAGVTAASAVGLDYFLKPQQSTHTTTVAPDLTPPVIADFQWKPDASNGHDGMINFTVSDEREVASARLNIVPVFPPEIQTAAIPPESWLDFPSPTPNVALPSGTAQFSQSVSDLKGGKAYTTNIIAKDTAGNQAIQSYDIPYMREFGDIVANAKLDISASYMPWNFGNTPGTWKKERPLMGTYDPVWESVRVRHLDWAEGHGVNAFLVDINEWNVPDQSHIRRVLNGLLEVGMKTGILWGPWAKNYRTGTIPEAPEWSVDLSEPQNKTMFHDVTESLIESSILSHPSYYRVKNQPVIFLYAALPLFNEQEAIADLRNMFRSTLGTEPFLIADLALRLPQSPSAFDWYTKSHQWKHLSSYDAITSWAGFIKWPVTDSEYVNNYETYYERSLRDWREFAKNQGLNFVPPVIPGFDNTYSWGPKDSLTYTRSVEKFSERPAIASKYVDELGLVRIDTWNDFGEWTYIEPSDKTRFDYLSALKNVVT